MPPFSGVLRMTRSCRDNGQNSVWAGYCAVRKMTGAGCLVTGGACGSEAFADKESGIAVGFTKNKVNKNHPDHITRNKISRVLGIPERVW